MKTIKEASESLEFNRGLIQSNPKLIITESFNSGVKFAQRWIPVEEESPAEYDYILAKSSVGDVYVACFSGYTFHTGMPRKVNITHWRPIEYK